MSFYTTDLDDLNSAPRLPTESEREKAERLTPVELRLGAALSKIPAAVQRKGLPIATIQAQLPGRTKGKRCDLGELAKALRRRGWQKRQHWERRNEEASATLWYPPGVDPVQASIAARMKLPPGRPPKWLAHARKLARESGLVF
jgi:hypothetical protein